MMSVFRHFFAAQDGPLAAARVVEAVTQALGITQSVAGGQSTASWRPSWLFRPSHPGLASRRRKFPTMDTESVRMRLETIARELGLEAPSISVCGEDLLHLYKAGLKARNLPEMH